MGAWQVCEAEQTVRDMVLSLAVIGAVVAGHLPLHSARRQGRPDQAVDYRVELLTARRAAPYPVAAPGGPAEGLEADLGPYERDDADAWHLGFLDPDGEYVAVEQSAGRRPTSSSRRSASRREETGKTAADRRRRPGSAGRAPKYDALVREDKGSTTVVTGTASFGAAGGDGGGARRPSSDAGAEADPRRARSAASAHDDATVRTRRARARAPAVAAALRRAWLRCGLRRW